MSMNIFLPLWKYVINSHTILIASLCAILKSIILKEKWKIEEPNCVVFGKIRTDFMLIIPILYTLRSLHHISCPANPVMNHFHYRYIHKRVTCVFTWAKLYQLSCRSRTFSTTILSQGGYENVRYLYITVHWLSVSAIVLCDVLVFLFFGGTLLGAGGQSAISTPHLAALGTGKGVTNIPRTPGSHDTFTGRSH